MSVQVPAGLLQELVDALKANAEASREAVRLARRSEPGEGGAGGITSAQVKGALGLGAAAAYGAAQYAGGAATEEGAVTTVVGGALGGAAAGLAVGGPFGMAVGGALGIAAGAVQVRGAQESLQAAEVKLADPTTDQVSREISQRRIDMTRDGEFGALAKIGRAISGEEGPDAALERERIARAPQARATARLAEEAAALGRYGYEMDEAQAAIRLGQYEEQERGADAGRLVNKVAAAKWSDRAGLAD